MAFDVFMTQRLKLIKKTGKVIEDIPASVQEKIYINDIKVPIEEGEIFEEIKPYSEKQLSAFAKKMRQFMPAVKIRGV